MTTRAILGPVFSRLAVVPEGGIARVESAAGCQFRDQRLRMVDVLQRRQ